MDNIYRCFEVKITSGEVGTYIVEGRYQSRVRSASVETNSALFSEMEVGLAKEWLERGFIDKPYSIDFGKRLFELLFREDVLDLYREAQKDIGTKGILVTALDFPVPPELAELPWELIHDPKSEQGFLARSPNSPFVRHYTDLPDPHKPHEELPVRVLIITASPPGKPLISGQRETDEIYHNLSKPRLNIVDILRMAVDHVMKTHSLKELRDRLWQRRLVDVDVLPHATRQKISEKLVKAKRDNKGYHVIHFIGHGQTNGEGLLLEAEPDQPPEISATEFAELVDEPTVNMVVLNACDTAGTGQLQNISKAILDRGVPAVVGMQIKIMDGTAVDFGREFYRMWAAGEPIESALARARRLMTYLSPTSASDWSIPVFYMGPLGPESGMELKLEAPPIELPWFLKASWKTLGAYVALVGILSTILVTGPQLNLYIRTQMPVIKCIFPYPMAEDPSFNIAIAPFTIVNQDKFKVNKADGYILANGVKKMLEENIEELDIENPDIRDPSITCPIKGQTPEQRQQAASKLAERIQADVLIYGIIKPSGNELEVTPEFYVNYNGFEQGGEIAGAHQLGSSLPLSEDEIQNGTNTQLITREKALIYIVQGLSSIALDRYEDAMDHFQTAEGLPYWYDDEGKAVLFLLMGGTSQSMATLIRDITPEEYQLRLNEAHNFYETAINLDKQYARAQLGLANVLYLEALGDPFGEGNNVDLDKLVEAEKAYQTVLDKSNAPESANITAKVHYGFGLIYLARGQLDLANSEFLQVVEYFQGEDGSLENLASHAYARLGWIARQRGDYPKAIELINIAIIHTSPYYRVRYSVLLGDTCREKGDIECACKTFQTAIGWAKNRGDQKTIQELQNYINNECIK